MKKKNPDKVDLNQLFPYKQFNVRVENPEDNRILWFIDTYDADKYITRYKLNRQNIKIQEKPDPYKI